ncbi:MAG: alpha/beta hydrolase [Actinobacteria bacterium]|nr:alpha/beta hydrolase [Actinomycetota bacterium]
MRRGHRFLAGTLGAAAGVAAAGRALRRPRPTPEDLEVLGSVRGEAVTLVGPRASRIYAERFPGTRGTVVLTHGWCLSEAVWHYQKQALADAGFTVIAWDLPGHGSSTPVARGHLTLGYLAGHPEAARGRVRGAVFVSTPLMHFARSIAGRWPGASLEARALGSAMEFMVSNPAIDRVFSSGIGERSGRPLSYRVVRVGFGRNPSPAHVRFLRDIIATVPPQVRVDTFRAMTGYDLTGALEQVKIPALVVLGERDRLVNPDETRLIGTRLARATTVSFPHAGHAAFLERSEEFNASVIAFAQKRLRPRTATSTKGARRAKGASPALGHGPKPARAARA